MMPHITLEHSANIIETLEAQSVLRKLHETLVTLETYKIQDVKGRIIVHERFLTADDPSHPFVHLHLAIMPRDAATKKETSARLMAALQEIFARSWKEKNASLSVEIRELDKDSYQKA